MTTPKQKKNSKLRHLEYYDLQGTFDKLYAESQQGVVFNNLMPLIACDENIRLAYRNIKRNSGSGTCGIDKLTIRNIEKIPESQFVEIVRKKAPMVQTQGCTTSRNPEAKWENATSGNSHDMGQDRSAMYTANS